jgi:hypothetical protein
MLDAQFHREIVSPLHNGNNDNTFVSVVKNILPPPPPTFVYESHANKREQQQRHSALSFV